MSDSRPEAEPTEVDFSAQAKRAEALRLAGDLDAAEATYADIAELGDARAEGYGNHHLGLCSRARGDQAADIGAEDLAAGFYDEAAVLYDKAFIFYFEAGDTTRASAARLDKGVLSLRRGQTSEAIDEIEESIKYLETHQDAESDQGFFNEHRGIKYARLAEAHLAAGDLPAAREAINIAEATPQRNPYFVMVMTEIDGYIYRDEGKSRTAREALTTAALKADALGEPSRKRRILDELEKLPAY